jgi:uncharacterized membrane protein
MLYKFLLLVHICSMTAGLLAGFMAMALRKGSGLHAAAGNVFAVSMLTTASSAVFIAVFLHPIRINVIAGLLLFYLVATGWRAAKQRAGGTGAFDTGALLFIAGVGLLGVASAVQATLDPTGMKDKVPAFGYLIFTAVALLFAVADVRNLIRGGATGAVRVGRHLWRMSLALLFTTFSLYPGQAKLFSKAMRATNLLYVPHLVLAGAIVFWLVRIGRRKRAQRVRVTPRNEMTPAMTGGGSPVAAAR